MIDINGIDKAELLAALVNGATPLGMGILRAGHDLMTVEEAQKWIDDGRSHDGHSLGARRLRFDYVKGRPIKSDLGGDELDPRLYDRDQGPGAAARVVAELRARLEKGAKSAVAKVTNVLDYGADPTGKTNSREAVQRAMAATPPGGTLLFPAVPPGGAYDMRVVEADE